MKALTTLLESAKKVNKSNCGAMMSGYREFYNGTVTCIPAVHSGQPCLKGTGNPAELVFSRVLDMAWDGIPGTELVGKHQLRRFLIALKEDFSIRMEELSK